MHEVITDNLDLWTSAVLTKAGTGRGSNGKQEAYGIKKLRDLILELAVRGKLVPQDPNDESAIILLEKIAKEKLRLIEDGKLAEQKPVPHVSKDEEYFSLPNGWAWSRLGTVTNYGISDKVESYDVDKDTWVLDLEDVEKGTSRLLKKWRFAERPFLSSKNRFARGDVIYGKLRPYLDKVIVADEDGVCTTEMVPVRGYVGMSPFYLRLAMKAPYFINYASDSTHGMNLPRLATDKVRMALFPLAPFAEQNRIVAKVEKLMALCDQLEQHQTDSLEAHQNMVETLLGTLTRVASQQELSEAWARIADHFDTLFTTEQSIDQLKQAILQLAVMGKLVPQDPNDEPASVLLEKIAKKKAQLAKEGEIKESKELREDAQNIGTEGLPRGWKWSRLRDLSYVQMGNSPPGSSYNEDGQGVPLINGPVEFSQGPYGLTKKIKFTTSPTYMCKEGDILVCVRGATTGRTNIASADSCIGRGVALIRAWEAQAYINLFMWHIGSRLLEAGKGTTFPSISYSDLAMWSLPVPPLEEQHRIVAKVDELIALCDALKIRIKDAQITKIHLADAIVEQAVA